MKDAAWLVAFGGEELFNTAEPFCWKTTKAYCKLVFGGRCYWDLGAMFHPLRCNFSFARSLAT